MPRVLLEGNLDHLVTPTHSDARGPVVRGTSIEVPTPPHGVVVREPPPQLPTMPKVVIPRDEPLFEDPRKSLTLDPVTVERPPVEEGPGCTTFFAVGDPILDEGR